MKRRWEAAHDVIHGLVAEIAVYATLLAMPLLLLVPLVLMGLCLRLIELLLGHVV